MFIPYTHNAITISGRIDCGKSDYFLCSFPGISIKIRIKNSKLIARFCDYGLDGMNNYFSVFVNGNLTQILSLVNTPETYTIIDAKQQDWCEVELFKRTESLVGECAFFGFEVDEMAQIESVAKPKRTIEFIGDSITCGYGIEAKSASDDFADRTENAWLSFASVASRLLNAQQSLVCYSGKGVYRNWASVPFDGDNMNNIYRRTLAHCIDSHYDHNQIKPDYIVVTLGSNDFSPPQFADEHLFKKAYTDLLLYVRLHHTTCPIICVTGPVLVKSLADQHNKFVSEIVDQLRKSGDSAIHFFALCRQSSRIGYGAQWHPSINQAEMNGVELAEFISNL